MVNPTAFLPSRIELTNRVGCAHEHMTMWTTRGESGFKTPVNHQARSNCVS